MSSSTLDRPAPPADAPVGADVVRRRSLPHRFVRGNTDDPGWARPALLALLGLTALLYLWDLGASGNANSFYAAAVQSGSESWKAWFFGALDPHSVITVDKPPAALWVMGLSARIFGYSSWSLLVPQALEGVAAVALLHATVRRVGGPVAGLLAGAALALTPAAVLMFRFDNPDALLLLLLVAAAYCTTRALESARTRWLVLAGVAVGFGFLTKSGQSLLVVPALALTYLVCAPTTLRRRLTQLVLALGALVVSSGWYIAVVAVWPASSRPFIGGSTDNSAWELAFGYNGLARLFGGSGNGGGGGGGGGGMGGAGNTSFGGATGVLRMFRGEFALEISWLLPAALIAIVALAWLTWSAPRTDRTRAALIMWGGSLLVTLGVFSFMQGTIHPYYSVALAPSIAALTGLAGVRLWQRGGLTASAVLAAMLVVTTGWGLHLLHTDGAAGVLVGLGAGVTVLALAGLAVHATRARLTRRTGLLVALVTVLALAVPTAGWGLATARTTHSGSIPTAASMSSSSSGAQRGPGGSGGGMGGGMGGGDSSSSTALTTALQKTTTTWSAATVGAQSAASLELSSDTAVIAIGGFSGSDAAPTLAQFKAYVAAGKITYFVVGQGGGAGGGQGGVQGGPGGSTSSSSSSTSGRPSGGPGGSRPSGAPTGGGAGGSSGSASAITAWVKANYSSTTIGGQTVYQLT